MGLYIPDLRLPADGDFELWIAVRKDGSFTYNIRGGWQNGKQKAISVQEPHGRLIDTDAADRNLLKMQQAHTGQYSHGIRKSRAVLRDAPTIIPASNELSKMADE